MLAVTVPAQKVTQTWIKMGEIGLYFSQQPIGIWTYFQRQSGSKYCVLSISNQCLLHWVKPWANISSNKKERQQVWVRCCHCRQGIVDGRHSIKIQ